MENLLMLAAIVGALTIFLERLHACVIVLKRLLAEFKRKKDTRSRRKRR